jgi:hypothetical protein
MLVAAVSYDHPDEDIILTDFLHFQVKEIEVFGIRGEIIG